MTGRRGSIARRCSGRTAPGVQTGSPTSTGGTGGPPSSGPGPGLDQPVRKADPDTDHDAEDQQHCRALPAHAGTRPLSARHHHANIVGGGLQEARLRLVAWPSIECTGETPGWTTTSIVTPPARTR